MRQRRLAKTSFTEMEEITVKLKEAIPLRNLDAIKQYIQTKKDALGMGVAATSGGYTKKTVTSRVRADMNEVGDLKGKSAMLFMVSLLEDDMMLPARKSDWAGVVTDFLELGYPVTDINTVPETGDSALHIAARAGYVDLVQALIGHGAEVGLKNNADQTAFDVAADHVKEAVKELQPNFKDKVISKTRVVQRHVIPTGTESRSPKDRGCMSACRIC